MIKNGLKKFLGEIILNFLSIDMHLVYKKEIKWILMI